MALITDYASLQTAIGDWLDRADLTTWLPNFIQNGESRIYRELRVRQMETALSATISAGVIAVPSGYVEMKHMRLDGSPSRPLERVTLENLYAQYPTRSADSEPFVYARNAGNFEFGPYPDSGYSVLGTYYAKLAALSASNTTNWLITDASDLILYAALCSAEPFLKNDARLATWEGMYGLVKKQVQDQDTREANSGSALRMRPA